MSAEDQETRIRITFDVWTEENRKDEVAKAIRQNVTSVLGFVVDGVLASADLGAYTSSSDEGVYVHKHDTESEPCAYCRNMARYSSVEDLGSNI